MIAFSIWSIDVYWYGIMYLLSFLFWYLVLRYGQKNGWYHNTTADLIIGKDLDWLILSILIGVMFGGRLGHIFIYDWLYFIDNPIKVFAFQEWWMSFIGGIIGVIISVIIYIYYFSPLTKLKDKNIYSLFDAIVPIVPVGIFFGRFGNFLNQELYGRVVDQSRWFSSRFIDILTGLNLLYVYDTIDNNLRINTNFLSMMFEWVMIALILWIFFFKKVVTKKRNSWQLSFVFLGLYSGVRFVLEYMRQDSQAEFVGWFTKSQWFFVVFFMIAIFLFIFHSAQLKEEEYTKD